MDNSSTLASSVIKVEDSKARIHLDVKIVATRIDVIVDDKTIMVRQDAEIRSGGIGLDVHHLGRDLMIRNFKVSALSCAHETLPTGDDVVSTVDPALVRTSSFYAYGFPPNPPGCNLFRGEREAFAHAVTYTVNRTSGHRRKESDITNVRMSLRLLP